jgi:hypothetical protein
MSDVTLIYKPAYKSRRGWLKRPSKDNFNVGVVMSNSWRKNEITQRENTVAQLGYDTEETVSAKWVSQSWNDGLIENIIVSNCKPHSHTKRQLRNWCNTKLSRKVSHNFSYVGNATVSGPNGGGSMFLRNVDVYVRLYSTLEYSTTKPSHSPLWEYQFLCIYLFTVSLTVLSQ